MPGLLAISKYLLQSQSSISLSALPKIPTMVKVTKTMIMCLDWPLATLTFILLCVRLYIRFTTRDSPSLSVAARNWSDVFVIFAWVTLILQTCSDTFLVSMDYPRYDEMYTEETITTVMKFSYWQTAVYWLTVYFVKASMLCFYNEWIPRCLTKTWWSIRIIGVLTFLGATSTFCLYMFSCLPIKRRWSLDPNDECYTQFQARVLYVYAGAMQLVTDLLVWILPFFTLPLLKILPPAQRFGCATMFCLGFCSMACTAVVAYTRFAVEDAQTLEERDTMVATNLLAATFEINTAVAVACIPALRAFVNRRTRMARIMVKWDGIAKKDSSLTTIAHKGMEMGVIIREDCDAITVNTSDDRFSRDIYVIEEDDKETDLESCSTPRRKMSVV